MEAKVVHRIAHMACRQHSWAVLYGPPVSSRRQRCFYYGGVSAHLEGKLTTSVIVLTRGDRDSELQTLADSFYLPPTAEGILVHNGAGGASLHPWRSVYSETNLGVPGGRNLGAQHAQGDVLVFLDDDARCLDTDLIRHVERRFSSESDLGIVGFRIVKPGSRESQQRWTPYVGMGDTDRTADVTTFVGGGHAIRRDVFEAVGGYFAPLFYALEETDLAWRVIDGGWRVSFDAEIMLEHPDLGQERHADVIRRTARNRVWLARRRLPLVIAPMYCVVWLAVQTLRSRSLGEWRDVLAGTWEGVTSSPGQRNAMRWATVAHMARLGRPPII